MSLAEADPPVRSHGDGEGDRRPVRRHRRRPRRPDRRLPAGQGGPRGHRPRGRGPGRRPGQDRRRPGRLPLRPRRPPLLHEERGGQRPLARDHGRRVPPAPAHVAHLLARQVPRLPAQGHRRHQEARPGRALPLRHLLPLGGREAQGPGGELRAVGVQPLRQAALPPLLQVLHREGLGRPDDRAARRVGRPADQGPVLLQRRQGRVLRQQGQQDQVAHRQVPVPPLRPGPDVGDDDRAHRGDGRRGAPRGARHEDRGRRRRGRGASTRPARSSSPAASSRRCRCARRSASSTRRRPPRSARRPRACATATS